MTPFSIGGVPLASPVVQAALSGYSDLPMRLRRRVSATYKDLPGGQVLGPTFDYTHRLLDFALAAEGEPPVAPRVAAERTSTVLPPSRTGSGTRMRPEA